MAVHDDKRHDANRLKPENKILPSSKRTKKRIAAGGKSYEITGVYGGATGFAAPGVIRSK